MTDLILDAYNDLLHRETYGRAEPVKEAPLHFRHAIGAAINAAVEAERTACLNFTFLLENAINGLNKWRDRPENLRWSQRIDGTPITNDLLVDIADSIADAIAARKNSWRKS